jgi:hypothetical protein
MCLCFYVAEIFFPLLDFASLLVTASYPCCWAEASISCFHWPCSQLPLYLSAVLLGVRGTKNDRTQERPQGEIPDFHFIPLWRCDRLRPKMIIPTEIKMWVPAMTPAQRWQEGMSPVPLLWKLISRIPSAISVIRVEVMASLSDPGSSTLLTLSSVLPPVSLGPLCGMLSLLE